MSKKQIIGREVAIDIIDEVEKVPAKVDTGADASAIWASDIFVDKDGRLHFKLFEASSPYYTGKEHVVEKYRVASTKSSFGDTVIKYRVKLKIRIEGLIVNASFGLSDRSTHNYPILIGRRTISGRFLVDVSLDDNLIERKAPKTTKLNQAMQENPYDFYKNNYLNRGKK